jgi:hypothetical protein
LGDDFAEDEAEEGVEDSGDLKDAVSVLLDVLGEQKYDPEDRHKIELTLTLHVTVLEGETLEYGSVLFVHAVR